MDLLLAPEPEEYFSYTRSFHGILLAIHSQEDFPDMSNSIVLQPGYHVKSFITPNVLTSDEAVCDMIDMICLDLFIKVRLFQVRSLPLSQRKCLFDDEVCTIHMSKRISIICTYPFFMHISNILQKQSEGIKKYNSARCLIDCRMEFIISQVSLNGF